MSLKAKYAKLEDAPEAVRSFYTEQNGQFVLAVDGLVGKDKLDEFRTNNQSLQAAQDAMTARFEGIDPDEYKMLKDEHEKIKTKKMMDAGKIDEIIAERTAAMKGAYEASIRKLTDSNGAFGMQLERLVIDNALQSEAAKAGVRMTAMEDVLLRGRQRFKMQEGKAVPMTDGKVVYGVDGSTPQTMGEWLSGLAPTAPHLFESSSGGGTRNDTRGAGGGKTMKRADFLAMSPQSQASFSKDGGVPVD